MRLFRALALFGLALFVLPLAGCANLKAVYDASAAVVQAKVLNPLNDKTVLALGATLSAANSIVIAYGALELCPVGQPASLGEKAADGKFCHDKQIFHVMHGDAGVAFTAYDELATLQQTEPQGAVLIGGSLHDKFTSAQGLVAAVTNLTNAYVAAQVSE